MPLSTIVTGLFFTLIFPGFLFSSIFGLFLTWVDRKVAAIVQSRIGPPWYQPYADIGKLLSKKMLIPKGSSLIGFVAAPLLAIASSTLVSVIIFRAVLSPTASFLGDLIVLLYLASMPAIALIIGGASSRSPFGAIGAGREMGLVLAYEISFLLSIITVFVKVGSIRIADIIAYQSIHGAIALTISGFIALVVALFCVQAKFGFLPFDISEADTEIIGGPLAEYSGVGLALFKISRAMLFLSIPVFLVIIFMGAIQPTFFSILLFFVKLLVLLSLIIIVKSTHARLRLDQALKLFWTRLTIITLISVFLAYVGL